MNVYIEKVVVTEDQPYGFLLFAVDFFFFQSGKFSNAIVNMGHEVSGLQRLQLAEGHGLGFGELFFGPVAVKTFKYLMVSIANNFQALVHKSLPQGEFHRLELQPGMDLFENALEAS